MPPDVVVVGLALLVVFVAWSANDGGYGEVLWYPAAVLLLILAGVIAWALPGRGLDGLSLAALGALSAFTVWSFLSILWAGDRGLALTGANRTLAYLLVFVVVLGRRWTWPTATAFAGVWASAVVVVGVVNLLHLVSSGHPEDGFTGSRLIVPIDYANANAALFLLAAWPLLIVSQSTTMPRLVRPLALGAAGVGVDIALLSQSKGGAIAAGAAVTLLLAVARRRVRLIVPMVLVAASVAVFHGPLFGVYQRVNEHPSSTVHSALLAMLGSFALLTVCGTIVLGVERALERLGARPARLVSIAAAALAIVLALAAVGVGIERYGSPFSIASRTWHAFKRPGENTPSSSHFVSTAGNHRYDFWRVSAHQFVSAPLQGKGAENFAADYVQRRQSSEEPLYPHSLELSLLGGVGLVGFLLFAVFAVAAAAICIVATRSRLPGRSAAGLIGLALFAYWLAHSSVDWLWEFPAITTPVFATVAIVASLGRERPRRVVPAWPVVLGLAGIAAAVALVPAWLAARQTAHAASIWRGDAAAAYSDLDSAARLNRVSDEPYVIAGTIAERLRNWALAERYFTRALSRNDDNWYSLLERGIADAMTGRRTRALAELTRAHRLDPREPIIRDVLAGVRAGRPIPIATLDQAMLERTTVPRGR